MSISGVGNSAYSYLQSLLQLGSTNSSATNAAADPLGSLLAAFYPAGADSGSTATAAQTNVSTSNGPPASSSAFSPDTLATLISIQGQQTSATDPISARAQALFTQIDANGDGQVSQSEFESVFGATADTSTVDGLFNALDANGDGSVSQDELTSAAKQAHAHHHHHHAHTGGSPDGSAPNQTASLLDTLLSTTGQGGTSQTINNSDGSTTTTITYTDGSKISMTSTPPPSGAGSSSIASGGQNSGASNLLEQLFQLQAQLVTPAAS